MKRLFSLVAMLVRENFCTRRLQRVPEDFLVMDADDQVSAWHQQGADDGPMTPVYHLNALACSRLTPENGTVVDLGCGSGRFSMYLAKLRPDIRVVGLDLSETMIEVGNLAIGNARLADRVELRSGDMTSFYDLLPKETSLIACQFAIHHLPTIDTVCQCFAELVKAIETMGCAIWLFDLARPCHLSTAVAYPQVLTPRAPEVFQIDSTNSLRAAYSHEELCLAIQQEMRGAYDLKSTRAKLFPLYQAFWLEGKPGSGLKQAPLSSEARLNGWAGMQYSMLKMMLWGIPQ